MKIERRVKRKWELGDRNMRWREQGRRKKGKKSKEEKEEPNEGEQKSEEG